MTSSDLEQYSKALRQALWEFERFMLVFDVHEHHDEAHARSALTIDSTAVSSADKSAERLDS